MNSKADVDAAEEVSSSHANPSSQQPEPVSDAVASELDSPESDAGKKDRDSVPHSYLNDTDKQDPVRLTTSPKDESGELDHSDKLKRCEEIIDYQFNDQKLLQFALTHASGATHRLASNERLEFLGDSILGFVVCSWLFEKYPEYSEGDLTKIKSAVVSRRTCGKVACHIGLDECLIVGRGVTRNRSYPRSLVSDVFESIIAAIYLDGGHEVVRARLMTWLENEVEMAVLSQGSTNYKSALQQRAQRDIACTPLYRLKKEAGPDHRKSFLISAVIEKREFTAAWGTNKKDAEQKAAANALAELNDEPVPFPIPDQETES